MQNGLCRNLALANHDLDGALTACEAAVQKEFGTQVSAARSQPHYLDVTHPTANKGVVVEVNSETDFVARNEQFRAFARAVALQVATGRGLQFVSEAEIPAEFKDQVAEYREKMIEGLAEVPLCRPSPTQGSSSTPPFTSRSGGRSRRSVSE